MAFEPRINFEGLQLELTKGKRGDFMPIWFDLLTILYIFVISDAQGATIYIHESMLIQVYSQLMLRDL